jgi:hypothetical protein
VNSASWAPPTWPPPMKVLRGFLPDYNRRFGHSARETEKAWCAAPKDLSRICCFVHERIVSNDNVVQWASSL